METKQAFLLQQVRAAAEKQTTAKPRCLCELCSCKPKVHICVLDDPDIPFDHESSYKNDYPPKVPEPVAIEEDPEEEPEASKFVAESTYHSEFKAIPILVEPEESMGEESDLESPPFEAVSTYSSQYQKKEIPKEIVSEEEEEPYSSPPFEAVSVYQCQFTKKPLPKPEPTAFEWAGFEKKSSDQLEYIRHSLANVKCPSCEIYGANNLVKPSTKHQYFVRSDGQWKPCQS